MNEDYSLHHFCSKMHELQNQSINADIARNLHNQQITGIKQAIDSGLELLKTFEKNKLSDDSPYFSWLTEHALFHQHIQQDGHFYLNLPEQFKLQQRKLYRLLDDDNIDESHALFFELLLGYTRFDLLIQSSACFFEFLNQEYELNLTLPQLQKTPHFFERLASISNAATTLHDSLSNLYIEQLDAATYWRDISRFFELHPNLNALAKMLFCMQYKPKHTDQISLAQMLHFNGMGGSFELFEGIKELAPLSKHAINIHGTQTNHLSKFDNTALFAPIYREFSHYVTTTLSDQIHKHYDKDTPLELYDLGCGSTCQGVIPLIQTCDDHTFRLVASDVDFHNIELISRLTPPNNCKIVDVRMDDLNQDLTPRKEDIDRFDICSASIVMHQLFPEEQQRLLRYLVQVTKPGGLISNPDAGVESTYKQIYVLPINTVDREGSVDWAPLKSTAVTVEQPHLIKIALPLFDLSYPNKETPYVYHLYQVHLIDKDILETLNSAIEKRDMPEVHNLLNKHCYSKT